ncbi:MAG: cation transporting ATPase C-terminal domain-containing protein, partial [Clostridia bacterium]|nr:cation transporting ATPase C-terminal domain-containing protein [Clostridia bacterium]
LFLSRLESIHTLSHLDKNKPFILIMLLISAIQIAMIYFGGSVFRCVPLTFKELFFVLTLAFTVIPFDTVRRIVKKLK